MKKIVVLIALLFLSASLFGQAQQREVLPYDALIRSAKIYLGQKDKDYDHVIELLNTAIDNYPDALEAHFYMGLIAAERAEYAKMMEHFRKFDEICSKEKRAADKKLDKRCDKDNMPKQIKDTKDAEFKRSFDHGVTQLRLADSVTKAMEVTTEDTTKAKQQEIKGKLLTKAQGLFNDCIIIDDTISGVWTNMALIEKKQNNIEKALEYYRRSYDLNPMDAMMVYDLASVYFEQKDYANSARFYGEFGDLDKNNAEVAYTNQALAYQMLKDNVKLGETLDKILTINPNNADIHYQRGVYYIMSASSQAFRDSAVRIDSMLTSKPNDAELKKAKDDMIKARNDFNAKAYADFKAATELNGNEPLYWYWYGVSAQFLDKPDESLTAYKQCVTVDANNKDCWCELSKAYIRKGMKAEAEQAEANCNKK